MEPLATALIWLDYAAVFVFGATGALAAARGKHDIVTFAFFSAFTGVGGGTLRDLLIGAPVFWVIRPDYLIVTLIAAVAVWVFGPRRFRERAFVWLDALGMSAYAVFGAAKATAVGVPPLAATAMGVLTAAFGGIIRDVLAGEPSVLLRKEIYITAALLGATVFVALEWLAVPTLYASLAGFISAFGLRACAIAFGWSLPAFRAGER
jgi:uncharacterized membrane protein YeiH